MGFHLDNIYHIYRERDSWVHNAHLEDRMRAECLKRKQQKRI